MEIDVLHRNDLCASATCSATFDAEDRPERWLSERHHRALANSIESHRQSNGGRRFAFAQWRGIDGRHENIPASRLVFEALECREADFALVPAIGMQFVRRKSKSFGDFLDREGLVRVRDVEVAHGL